MPLTKLDFLPKVRCCCRSHIISKGNNDLRWFNVFTMSFERETNVFKDLQPSKSEE